MIVKLDNSQHCEVPLSLLMKYSPYVSPIWADCEAGSITLGGVGKKLESKLFARKRFSEDVIFESELYWKKNLYPVYETKAGWHEARIAYLVANPSMLEAPIVLDYFFTSPIADGNHRVGAAIYLRLTSIKAFLPYARPGTRALSNLETKLKAKFVTGDKNETVQCV